MASKLELRFTTPGELGTITIASGMNYTFKFERLGARQVAIGKDELVPPLDLARNFLDAFNTDDNYLDTFTVSYRGSFTDADGIEIIGDPHGIVTIEHPLNNFFDAHSNVNTFVTSTITTTPEVPAEDLTVTLSEATIPCGRYKATFATNVTAGVIKVEQPVGNVVGTIVLDGSASYELELVRPSAAQTSVAKIKEEDESYEPVLVETLFVAPPVLSIQSVEVTGSPFGAMVLINTNSGLTRTYSLDGTTYQGSREFAGLLAGNYTAHVKDLYGCTQTKTFSVTEEQAAGLSVEPFIRIPVHNSIHFVDRSGGSLLNFLSTEMPGHASIKQYFQEYLVGDSVRTQFKSSYANNKVWLIDETGAETEITIIKKSTNINRVNIYEGNYTEKDGRVAVYFTSGNIYNADGTTQTTGHILNGLLPRWYEEGVYLNIEGVGVTQIDRILVDEDGITYAITNKDAAGTVTGKNITSVHTEHPYEVYEFEVYFPSAGKFQLRVEYGDSFYLSEILRINEELPEEYLEIQWWNDNNNDILYNTGIRHFRRLAWENYFTLRPKTNKETFATDTSVELINSQSFAVYELALQEMPMEPARGLQVGIDNSSKVVVNGAVFLSETPVKFEDMGQWYLPVLELTLVDQTMNGQQEIVDVINAEFLNVGTVNNVSFLRLN